MEPGLIGDIVYGLCELFVRAVVGVFNLVAGPVGYVAGRTVRLYRRVRHLAGMRSSRM